MSQDATPSLDAGLRTAIDKSTSNPVMFFFTSGAAWLAVSILLGIFASIKFHTPTFMEGIGALTTGRAYAAHLNVLIYGWCFQAAFGTIIWLMSRLCRKEFKNSLTVLVAGHLWNATVALGLIGILLGNGSGVPFMEFPQFTWVIFLILYLFIAVPCFVQFRVRQGGHVYISQWYLLAALFLFPWIYGTANVLVFVAGGSAVMTAAVAAWFKSALILLFFVPVAIAAAYYLAPKVTGRPVYSYNLALLGFWALVIVAPWTGMQKLTGAPIPAFMTYVSAGATALFFLPALTVGSNILMTIKGHFDLAAKSPALRFTTAGVIGLLGLGLAGLWLNLPEVLKGTQFSLAGYGYDMLALYGVFSMIIFGAIYFIVPRVTGREWLAPGFIRLHFNLSAYSVIAIVMGSILGGYMQGAAQLDYLQSWMIATKAGYAWDVFNSFAWGCILISNIFFCFHLLLMWARLGRHSKHPTLLIEKHGSAPHGADGKVQNI